MGRCVIHMYLISWGGVLYICTLYHGEVCYTYVPYIMGRCVIHMYLISWGGVLYICTLYHGEVCYTYVPYIMGRCVIHMYLISWGGVFICTLCPGEVHLYHYLEEVHNTV